MKLTIVVPIYNVELYIEECLASIYQGGLEDFEVLCIDDRGTDESIERVRKFVQSRKIQNLEIIEQPENRGLSEARNLGIDKAKGKYICFLDSDDKINSNNLKDVISIMEEEDLDIIEGKMMEIFETQISNSIKERKKEREDTGVLTGDEYFKRLCEKDEYYPMACGRIFKTENLKKNHCYFVPNLKFEDEEFSPRAILSVNKVRYVNISFYVYRRRENSITTSMFDNERWYESYLIIIENLRKYLEQIKHFQSYEFLKNRIGQIALSILKNPIEGKVSEEHLAYIIEEVKNRKIYQLPISCKNFFIKMQGYVMRFPRIFIQLYKIRGKIWRK